MNFVVYFFGINFEVLLKKKLIKFNYSKKKNNFETENN